MENNQDLTTIYKEYLQGKKYFTKMELDTIIPTCVDFYEGRQWGKIGEKTKKLPRATFNLIELIVNSKVSTMLSSPLKIVFTSSEMPKQAYKLTRFNSLMEKEMDYDTICEDILDQAAVEGSSFIHFYWDSDAIGKRGEYRGGVRAEKVDLLNVVVENPCQTSIQKQKWIILETKVSMEEAQELCESKKDRKLIEYDSDQENSIEKKVTVLTKYFRINGEVYFEKATKNVLLHKPRPLNPDLLDKNILNENNNRFIASLYPVEVYQYKQRKNCIYGRGEVEPIISNNRTINFNTAMMSKGVEDQGFGTIVQREGALRVGEKITNDSSKILIDRYKGGQNGFYNLTKQPFNPSAYQLNKDILETTRQITGATEVMTGEVMYNNQSGTSIAYLQQQARRPLEKLCKRYKQFRIRCAEIMFQFYCLFYEEKDFFSYESNLNQSLSNANVTIKDTFKSKEYRKIDFDITVEIGSTNEYSEIAELSLLDTLLKGEYISLKTYYKLYPDHLLPSKEQLLSELETTENEQLKLLEQENNNLKNEINELKNTFEYNVLYKKLLSLMEENKKLITKLVESERS
ncbi:MAG: hypothetical protein IJW82_05955 [Clostridia bacterium]|nr:hypothetical protein [Clostridia bacterium]